MADGSEEWRGRRQWPIVERDAGGGRCRCRPRKASHRLILALMRAVFIMSVVAGTAMLDAVARDEVVFFGGEYDLAEKLELDVMLPRLHGLCLECRLELLMHLVQRGRRVGAHDVTRIFPSGQAGAQDGAHGVAGVFTRGQVRGHLGGGKAQRAGKGGGGWVIGIQ